MQWRLLISRPWDRKSILNYSGGPNIITRVLTSSGKSGSESEKFEDSTQLALKRKKGIVNQGMLVASRSWEKEGIEFPLESPERNAALPTPDFSPVRPILDFWPLYCFKPLYLEWTCYSSNRKLWHLPFCSMSGEGVGFPALTFYGCKSSPIMKESVKPKNLVAANHCNSWKL